MSSPLEARPAGVRKQPVRGTKKEVEDLLGDIAEGLELSRQLLLFSDGPFKKCGHSGHLPLQGILRDCAHRIVIEAMRCRADLEASGGVSFGSVVLEEGADSDGTDTAAVPPWGGPPCLADPLQHIANRCLCQMTSPEARSMKTEPSPLGTLRRLYSAILARPMPEGPRWSAAGPRQGGT
jgi:hypothetical protein